MPRPRYPSDTDPITASEQYERDMDAYESQQEDASLRDREEKGEQNLKLKTVTKDHESMLWQCAAHYAQGMFEGLTKYMAAQNISKEIKDHVKYLSEDMQNEIEKIKRKLSEPDPLKQKKK